MCGSPGGVGQHLGDVERIGAAGASSLETSHVRSRSQIACHLGSTVFGS